MFIILNAILCVLFDYSFGKQYGYVRQRVDV